MEFIKGLIVGLIMGEIVVFTLFFAGAMINDKTNGSKRKEGK